MRKTMATGMAVMMVLIALGMLMPVAAVDGAGVTLTPAAVSRLYALADGIQSDGVGGYLGEGVYGEDEWNVLSDQLGSPSAETDDDPIGPTEDGWTLDGISSFAIAHSKMTDAGGWSTADNSDTLELFVNNQATQHPPGYGPEGWGYSVSYLLITYNTAPFGGYPYGDPMTVTLDISFSGTLYAADVYDEYFLDIGYALGTGLTDYNPALDDAANQPNPGLDQFDVYHSWRSGGFSFEPAFSDSLEWHCAIGDQVQLLIAVSSFSYSWWGYTWTDGTLEATISAVPDMPPPPPVSADINIDPDTLNLKSNGKWITAYITLPEGYSVDDIDLASVRLGDVTASWGEVQGTVLMVKFDRQFVASTLSPGSVTLTITGELISGQPFTGSDTIRVLSK